MNKFSIKAFGKRKSCIKFSAFTVAEMLLVLLIISFLIIAIPPLVNKKIAKKVMRGEHGRYECWINPEDGATYEYLATERHGVGAIFHHNGDDLGRKLGPNERCRFKPAEMAPTAPYFVMQIIGGGGGGAYAPYRADNTDYHKVEDEKATVKAKRERSRSENYAFYHNGGDSLNVEFKYGHSAPTGCSGAWNVNGKYYACNLSAAHQYPVSQQYVLKDEHSSGYTGAYTDRVAGTAAYKNCGRFKWVYEYFPPVLSYNGSDNEPYNVNALPNGSNPAIPLKICSGHGPRGDKSEIGLDPNHVTSVYVLDEYGEPTNEVESYIVNTQQPSYGHRGGYGYCVTINPNKRIAVSRESSGTGSSFSISTKSPFDSYDYALYYADSSDNRWYLLEYVKANYDYDSEGVQGDKVRSVRGNQHLVDETLGTYQGLNIPKAQGITPKDQYIKMCPYTSWWVLNSGTWVNTYVPGEGPLDGGTGVCTQMLSNRDHGPERPYYNSTYTYVYTNPHNYKATYFRYNMPYSTDMGIVITAATLSTGDNGTIVEANCSIPGGGIGEDARVEDYTYDIAAAKDVKPEDVDKTEDTENVWMTQYNGADTPNLPSMRGGRKGTYPWTINKLAYVFPEQIQMRRSVLYESNTYGFAGLPGKTVNLSLAKLTGTLEFDIGSGGRAGVFGDTEARRGKTGTNTVVWRKKEGTPDNVKCENGEDGTPTDSRCAAIAVAQGGRGYRTGAIGRKIVVRGDRTGAIGDETNTATTCGNFAGVWTVKIDGCLDKDVGPREESNKLRFAEDSKFYIIPELDSESVTVSAIEKAFKNKNMPGSGGDGGYSFLKNINDTERLQVFGHTNFNHESLLKLGAGDNWEYNNGWWTAGRTAGLDAMLDYSNYRCYLKNDVLNNPRLHPENHEEPEVLGAEGYQDTAFCKPQDGMPGAVVIVW